MKVLFQPFNRAWHSFMFCRVALCRVFTYIFYRCIFSCFWHSCVIQLICMANIPRSIPWPMMYNKIQWTRMTTNIKINRKMQSRYYYYYCSHLDNSPDYACTDPLKQYSLQIRSIKFLWNKTNHRCEFESILLSRL